MSVSPNAVNSAWTPFPTLLITLALLSEALFILTRAFTGPHSVVEAIVVQLLTHIVYLVSIACTFRRPAPVRIVIVAALVFRATAFPVYPFLSEDVYRYRWEGKLQAAGGNPYDARPNDPRWSELRDATFDRIPGRDFRAVYGPLIESIQAVNYAAVARFSEDPWVQAFWFKLPGVLGDIGILLLLARLAPAALILYAWCPTPIVEFWMNGHNDSIAVLLVLAAVFAAQSNRWVAAFASLTLAAGAKLWPALLFPVFLARQWRAAWISPIVALGLIAPYWTGVTENVQFATGFIGGWRNNDALYGPVLALIGDVYTTKYVLMGLVAASSVAIAFLRWPVSKACLAVLTVVLLLSSNIHPWYVTWLIPLLALNPWSPLFLWIGLMPLAYEVLIAYHMLGVWQGSVPGRWYIHGPFLGFGAAKWCYDNAGRVWPRMRCWVLVLFLAPLAYSQPQFLWQGEVDGVSVLHIRGNRVDVQDLQGMPVQRQNFRFYQALPSARQSVRLEVIEGRGRVRMVEDPGPNNNFTAMVRIEDPSAGQGFYSIALHWQGSGRAPFDDERRDPFGSRPVFGGGGGRNGDERLTWNGRVDDEVIIECRFNDCQSRPVRGQPAMRERVNFSRPLPDRSVRVSLDEIQGRGEVQLIDQPNESNGNTARVRIRDHQGGAGDYTFSLFWNRPSRSEPDRLYSTPGMMWFGRVDGRVRVTVQGDLASSEVINGGPVAGERTHFLRRLPNRGNVANASVRRMRGRGRVEIVEFPSARNSYRLVFEVDDSGGGADNYEVEVGW